MQIFWNLLRNSVKFTPEGGTIVVRTWNEQGQLMVEITDTGVGIEAGSLPHIFEAFSQGAPARGGRGLGLSISKAIADLHGGRITAVSPGYGLGATFRVELPTGGWPAEAERSAYASLSSGSPAGFARVGMRRISGSRRSRNTT
jgi:signal transduction histidine kinase